MAWGVEELAAAVGIFIGVAGFGLAGWHEFLRLRDRSPRLQVKASWSYLSDPRRSGLHQILNIDVTNVGVRPAQLSMMHFRRKKSTESMILRNTLVAGWPKRLDVEETFQHVVPTHHFHEWATENGLPYPLQVCAVVQTPRGNVNSNWVELEKPSDRKEEAHAQPA